MADPRLEPLCSLPLLAALKGPVEEALKGLRALDVAIRLKADSLRVCPDGCERLTSAQLVLVGNHHHQLHVHPIHWRHHMALLREVPPDALAGLLA